MFRNWCISFTPILRPYNLALTPIKNPPWEPISRKHLNSVKKPIIIHTMKFYYLSYYFIYNWQSIDISTKMRHYKMSSTYLSQPVKRKVKPWLRFEMCGSTKQPYPPYWGLLEIFMGRGELLLSKQRKSWTYSILKEKMNA